MALYKEEYEPAGLLVGCSMPALFSHTVESCVSLLHDPLILFCVTGLHNDKKVIIHWGRCASPHGPCHEPTGFTVRLGCLWVWLSLACAPLISHL